MDEVDVDVPRDPAVQGVALEVYPHRPQPAPGDPGAADLEEVPLEVVVKDPHPPLPGLSGHPLLSELVRMGTGRLV